MADDWSKSSDAFLQPTVEDCDPTTPAKDGSSCWAKHLWESVRLRTPAIGGEFPVGLVCVDEVHFLGNAQRGHLLEMLLAKLRFLNQFLQRPVQVVGMSATLSNAQQVGPLHHIASFCRVAVSSDIWTGKNIVPKCGRSVVMRRQILSLPASLRRGAACELAGG